MSALEALRTQANAARAVSSARADLDAALEQKASPGMIDDLEHAYFAAVAAEYVARQMYTNPFGTEKTFS